MEKEQNKKNFLITITVIFLSVLIFIFWFLNSRGLFDFKGEKTVSDESAAQIEFLRQEFEETFNKLSKELADFRTDEELRKITESKLFEEINSELKKISSSSPEKIDALKTIPQPATNCPAYVNCMPTIGAAPSCQIPPGCEGMTQIVY